MSKQLGIAAFLSISLLAASAQASPSCEGVFIRQHGPTAVRTGELLVYKIQLTNEGPCDLDSMTVTDYLPRNTLYREGTPVPSQVPAESGDPRKPLPVRSLRWNDISLGAHGGQATFEVKLQVEHQAKRTITETACVEGPDFVRNCNTLEIWVAQ